MTGVSGNRLWIVGLVLISLATTTTRLFAHATLIRTEPASGAILTQLPHQIRLEFSEPIEAGFNGIEVYNSKGLRMESGHAAPDPNDVRVLQLTLQELPSGAYTVVWHVVSADGHPIEGAFGFAVGTGVAGIQSTIVRPPEWKRLLVPIAGATHGVAIFGMLLFAGLPLFYWVVFRPAANILFAVQVPNQISQNRLQLMLVRLLQIGLLVAIFASIVSLLVEAVRVAGDISAVVSGSVLFRLVSGTRFGRMWSVRMAGLLVSLGLTWRLNLARSRRISLARWVSLTFVSIILLLTPGLGGHPGAAPDDVRAFLVAADWLHLLAAAPWVAGLCVFAFLLPGMASWTDGFYRAKLTVALVGRFPMLAAGAVALLVGSGVFGALEHIPTWSGLFHTSYGQAILTKSALLLPVLALAATHHFVFRRQALRFVGTEYDPELMTGFRNRVRLEFVLVAMILLTAGLLVNLPPAEASLAKSSAKVFEHTEDTAGVNLTVRIRPARVGLNSAEVGILSHDNSINPDQIQPTIVAKMLNHDMGVQEIVLKRLSKNEFRAEGLMLGMSGPWEIGVVAPLQDGREIRSTFRFYVPPAEQ